MYGNDREKGVDRRSVKFKKEMSRLFCDMP